jgi:hypothetical protein
MGLDERNSAERMMESRSRSSDENTIVDQVEGRRPRSGSSKRGCVRI